VTDSLAPVVDGTKRVFCCHMANLDPALPANSLAAVKACVAAAVPRLEIDVRFMADGSMLVFHDATLDRDTDSTGRVEALVRGDVERARFRGFPDHGPCFLEDVVEALDGTEAVLQVDLKSMRPLSQGPIAMFLDAITPLGERALVGSQAHWNLRPLVGKGCRLAIDPSLQWHYSPAHRIEGIIPARLGLHGLWDDSFIAHLGGVDLEEYISTRVADIHGLLPEAVEWMVDIQTLLYLQSKGVMLGSVLLAEGIELAAWTMRDEGHATSSALLAKLFSLGTKTVITDHAPALAGYVQRGLRPLPR